MAKCDRMSRNRCSKLIMGSLVLAVLACICFIWRPKVVFGKAIAGGYVIDTEGNRCGTLRWSLGSDGTFKVTGKGPGASYRPEGENEYDKTCPWDKYREKIKRVVFECEFTGSSLYHYEYGASITAWFANCVNLESYSDIPSGVTDMSAAFLGCKKLTQCGVIPDTVVIMQYTFADCTSLKNPPEISINLTDSIYGRRNDKKVGVPAYALGMTFAGCTSLVTTPVLNKCKKIYSLAGTFYNCTSLVTIKSIPSNVTYLQNTFNNCKKVRGVLSCAAKKIDLAGTPFENIAQNNKYILFVKSPDSTLFENVKEQAGENFRGYVWDDIFTIKFNTNGGKKVTARKIVMEYGVNLSNDIDKIYKQHIAAGYYSNLPDVLGKFQTPVRAGYKFAGWYYDEELTKKAVYTDLINPNTEDLYKKKIILYAKWLDTTGPEIEYDFIDKEWYNKPVKIIFTITDANAGLTKIVLYQNEDGVLKQKKKLVPNENERASYAFSYTFGNVKTKLYEGITQWEVHAFDESGNKTIVSITIRLDYTKPLIFTDSAYDSDKEIIYDNREEIDVWCMDELSGPGILKINPSNYQNTFVDMSVTPYVSEEKFLIQYRYCEEENIYGYVLYAMDKAGNFTSKVVINEKNMLMNVKRVIPRDNYD